jgi:hypothetical protein
MKKKLVRIVSVLTIVLFSASCSTSPNKISASYVSPIQYQGYSCSQIQQELVRVNSKVLEVTGQQKREATKDAWAFGVGMVLFWPALFFMIGDDKKEELSRLKGEYDALQAIAIEKDCRRKMEEKKQEEQKAITEEEPEKEATPDEEKEQQVVPEDEPKQKTTTEEEQEKKAIPEKEPEKEVD